MVGCNVRRRKGCNSLVNAAYGLQIPFKLDFTRFPWICVSHQKAKPFTKLQILPPKHGLRSLEWKGWVIFPIILCWQNSLLTKGYWNLAEPSQGYYISNFKLGLRSVSTNQFYVPFCTLLISMWFQSFDSKSDSTIVLHCLKFSWSLWW